MGAVVVPLYAPVKGIEPVVAVARPPIEVEGELEHTCVVNRDAPCAGRSHEGCQYVLEDPAVSDDKDDVFIGVKPQEPVYDPLATGAPLSQGLGALDAG